MSSGICKDTRLHISLTRGTGDVLLSCRTHGSSLRTSTTATRSCACIPVCPTCPACPGWPGKTCTASPTTPARPPDLVATKGLPTNSLHRCALGAPVQADLLMC